MAYERMAKLDPADKVLEKNGGNNSTRHRKEFIWKEDDIFISYLVTFSRLIEHFQMAPVAAASNSLFSILNDRDTRGSRPPYFRTRSRVSSSSAHWKQVQVSVT